MIAERLVRVISQSKVRLAWSVVALAACVCAGAVLTDSIYLTAHFFQPLFVMDHWETVKDFKAFKEGTYKLSSLFSQHNEHRIAVPRLVFFADYELNHGLNIINVAAIYLVQFLHAALFIAMASRRCGGAILAIVAAAIIVLLFSYGQYDNLTFGFQVQFVGVYAAATAACLAAATAMQKDASPRSSVIATACAMLAATIATYMMSNGVLSAAVMVGIAIVTRASKALLTATIVFAAAILFAFFHGAHFGDVAPPLEMGLLARLGAVAGYFLIYIGGIAGSFGLVASGMLGFVGFALSTGAALRLIRRETDAVPMALFGIMTFVIGTAAITAWGRVGFGLPQALSNRYMTPSAVFWSAQLVYWGILAHCSIAQVPRACFLLLVGTTMACAVERHIDERRMARPRYIETNLATDMLLSSVVVPNIMETIYPHKETVERLTPFLAHEKLNIFALPEASWRGKRLADVFATIDDGRCEVVLDKRSSLDARGDAVTGGIAVEGWAWDKRRRRPVERIVIVGADQTIVGFGSFGWWRPEWRSLPGVNNAEPGWKGFAAAGATDALRPYAILDRGKTACGGR